eukprot:182170-Prorocentrum_minimum.AAC.3
MAFTIHPASVLTDSVPPAGKHSADVLPSGTQGSERAGPLAEGGRKDYAVEDFEANRETLTHLHSEGGKEGGEIGDVWVVQLGGNSELNSLSSGAAQEQTALYRSRMGAMFGKIAVEVPQYEVLLKKPLYEIRKYPPFVIVSTSAEDMVEGNNSFGKLAKYIGVFGSPENSKKEAISMTAPVVTGLESSLVTPCLQRHAVDTP